MTRILTISLASLITLSGCSVLFPEDSREGAEATDKCVSRVTGSLKPSEREALAGMEGNWRATYTFDVTKMDLEAIQELSVAGSDETAGARDRRATTETSTAVDQFMATPVDEDGAFFLGREPALYRVLGEPQTAENLIAAGCERQKDGMRLISLTWGRSKAAPSAEGGTNPNELDARGEPMEYDMLEKNN